MEALFSTIVQGSLSPSSSEQRGERFLDGALGVYVHKDAAAHKSNNYIRFVQLIPFGCFYAVKWEVRVDRNLAVKPPRQTDQLIHKPEGVRLAALWICALTADEMLPGTEFSPVWGRQEESNPYAHEGALAWQAACGRLGVPPPPPPPPCISDGSSGSQSLQQMLPRHWSFCKIANWTCCFLK